MPQLSMHTPIADLTLTEEDGAIVALDWGWSAFQEKTDLLVEAKHQLDAYFDGELTAFDLPLNPCGTTHQKKVWALMQAIPYGSVLTYGAAAKQIGSAAQAVGTACGLNAIPVIIPCHRIVGSGGRMGGYSGEGGVYTKKALLILEGALNPD